MAALTYIPVFAHLGHWYVSLPVFGGPVVVIAVVVKLSERRERRRVRAGDPSRLRVAATHGEDRTILTVNGTLDYPAVLSIEAEIDAAIRRGPRALLDLSNVTSVEVDLAWSLAEVINAVKGADVALVIGADPALDPLRKICALEGIKVVEESTSTVDGVPQAASTGR
jgi:anti-anti-sigma regulatory factor